MKKNKDYNKVRTKKRRRGIGVDDLLGFDEDKVEELSKKHSKIRQIIKTEFGKVSRYRREILRQRKSVKCHTDLLNKYLDLMEKEKVRYLNMMKLLDPKVTLKRPTKNFHNWRGKVYWGVGGFKKRGWKEFHIISEKKRLKLGLSEDEVRDLGKDKFRDNLIKNDLSID